MPYLSSAALGLNNHVCFVGYMNGLRPDAFRRWTPDRLRPYVLYDGEAGPQRYFGGLLFEAGSDAVGGLISPRYLGMAGPAGQAGWEHAVEELFAANLNLRAALDASAGLPKGRSIDIWIALPYPPGNQKRPFGVVRGRTVRFADGNEARIASLQWWIELVRQAWRRAVEPEHQARLAGFVWLKNYLSPEDERLVRAIGRDVRASGLRLMWCQNYGTAKAHMGADLGFDLVATRPTYREIEQRGEDWVKTAALFSRKYGLGMILWEPEGAKRRMESWLRLGEACLAGAYHLYEFGIHREGAWIHNDDPFYERLYRYMRNVDTARVDSKRGATNESFA